MTGGRYSWTQPICDPCWVVQRGGGDENRLPVRIKPPWAREEVCVYCGQNTESGIFIRVDPAEAPHPTIEDED